MSIVLPLRSQAELTNLLKQLYDPSSPSYRHFLSLADFTERFAPTDDDYQQVVAFARSQGFTVKSTPANRLVVPIVGTVHQVQDAFGLKMRTYRHPTENRVFFSADREPSVPSGLPVAHIAGLNNYSLPKPLLRQPLLNAQKPASVQGSGPGGYYLGSDMRAAYYGGTALTGSGQSVALAQFGGYDIEDVVGDFAGTATASANGSNFILNYTPISDGTTNPVAINNVLLDGQTLSPQGDDAEEALDIAQAIGMAPGLSQVRVYIGNLDVDILNAIASDDAANQVSISWTWSPDDPEVDDFIFQEMAAQGQSVFAASGDYGSYSVFFPSFFPAEDAYVTAVGGTTLTTSGPGGTWQAESAWPDSGGGVSPDSIPAPPWQQGIATLENQASPTYRNVPDVAMEGDFDNYTCSMSSCNGGWAGTSFAAPRWAGYMALVNQAAAAQGQNPIGFFNPLVYAIGQGPDYSASFHDIVSGSNGHYASFGVPYFYAVPGYDLVTGWGSPAGGQLVSLLAPASSTSFQLTAAPTNLTIQPGGSGTTTITVNALGGFSAPVTLSINAAPPGITATFSQNPVTTSSVLTLSADPASPRGSFLLKINGTANGQTMYGDVAVQVNAPGMMVSPVYPVTPLWTSPGYSSSVELDMSSFAGFDEVPSLSITSPLPSGITAVLNPNTMSSPGYLDRTSQNSASVHFIGDDFALPPGSVSGSFIQVTAQAGDVVDTRTVYLAVVAPQYELDMQPMLTHLVQGGSVQMTVSAYAVGNFGNDTISLSPIAPLPSGVTVSFDPSAIQVGQTSTMTVTATPSATLGTFEISVWGYDTVTQLSGPYFAWEMNVEAPPGNSVFQIVPSAGYVVAPQGSSFTNHFTVLQENGFDQEVWLEPAYIPGMSPAFGPRDAAGGADVTFTSPSSIGSGLWICGGYGYVGNNGPFGAYQEGMHVWILSTPTLPFALSTQIGAVTLNPGGFASTQVSIALENGYTGTVALTATGLPDGLSANFDANPTQIDTTLRLTAGASLPTRSYFVNVSATGNGQTLVRTIPVQVQVGDPQLPTPTFSVAPGTYTSAFTLTIGDTNLDAVVYYTTDGSNPTTSSMLYNGPITVSSSEIVQAIAAASGYSASAVASAA
ncbi:MAG: protease pro-enzyme activation domain-containing protein, partial [Candidatus Korobacteraceae bacterium]